MLMVDRYSNEVDVCRLKGSTPVGEIGSENPGSANDEGEWDITYLNNIHEVLNCLTGRLPTQR